MSQVSHGIDRVEVIFDDETLVADAGLIVPATLMVRLGLEALIDHDGAAGGPGRRCPAGPQGPARWWRRSWRAGRTSITPTGCGPGRRSEVLPFRVMAPSTLGTFLRAFTFGHVRQLDAVIAETIRRAWALGAGPGDGADDDRCGLDDLRGPRQAEAGRRLRLHPGARLPPAAGHPGRHRRGAPRPAAQGLLPAGPPTLRRRARRPGPPGRRHRRR